ncbi:FAD-binding oxidoreductase [Bacteroidota bacterium]
MIIKTENDFLESYLKDASNFYGRASVLYIPENTDELKQAITDCYAKGLPITISGARTGLTGSAVPLNGAVISTEKLNRIIKTDVENETAILEPGVIISDFQEELKSNGFFYAPNPTEQNSSIGGNVGTSASGARTFKYGTTRNFVKRLKLFLSNGEELNLLREENYEKDGSLTIQTSEGSSYKLPVRDINMPEVKHAAGYFVRRNMDAIDLFIGSEGTLGVVAEIEVGIVKTPEKVLGGLVFFDNSDNMLRFVDYVRNESIINNKYAYYDNSNIASRLIEYFDNKSLDLLREKFSEIPENCAGGIWFEQEYAGKDEDAILDKWYEIIKKFTEYSDNTWIAMNDSEHKKLSEFRHELPLQVYELISKYKSIKIGTDSAVPAKYLSEYYHFLKSQLDESGLLYFLWGHIGNTHFHANILSKNDSELFKAKEIYKNCIGRALELGGTVSAEHGIGKMKKEYLLQMYGEGVINYMKQVKNILDKDNILGKGNLFD